MENRILFLTAAVCLCIVAMSTFLLPAGNSPEIVSTQDRMVNNAVAERQSSESSDSPIDASESKLPVVSETGTFEIALTVDDLPRIGTLPTNETRAQIMQKFISVLVKEGLVGVTTGFANGDAIQYDPALDELMTDWAEAGLRLGNHTYSHTGLHNMSTEDFLKDIRQVEPMLARWTGENNWRYFRYPYLEEGKDLEQWRTVKQYLHEENYRVAEVTLEHHDWRWNDAWVRCYEKGNESGMDWVRRTYIEALLYAFRSSVDVSLTRWGRPIKFVLMIHLNSVGAAMLSEVISVLRQQGVKFISLDEALDDPVYTMPVQANNYLPTFQNDWRHYYTLHARAYSEVVPIDKLEGLCR